MLCQGKNFILSAAMYWEKVQGGHGLTRCKNPKLKKKSCNLASEMFCFSIVYLNGLGIE